MPEVRISLSEEALYELDRLARAHANSIESLLEIWTEALVVAPEQASKTLRAIGRPLTISTPEEQDGDPEMTELARRAGLSRQCRRARRKPSVSITRGSLPKQPDNIDAQLSAPTGSAVVPSADG